MLNLRTLGNARLMLRITENIRKITVKNMENSEKISEYQKNSLSVKVLVDEGKHRLHIYINSCIEYLFMNVVWTI